MRKCLLVCAALGSFALPLHVRAQEHAMAGEAACQDMCTMALNEEGEIRGYGCVLVAGVVTNFTNCVATTGDCTLTPCGPALELAMDGRIVGETLACKIMGLSEMPKGSSDPLTDISSSRGALAPEVVPSP